MKNISKHDKRIMDICKRFEGDRIQGIQDYLREEYYGNEKDLPYVDLFRVLFHTCSHLLDDWQIVQLIELDISKKLDDNRFWEKRDNITSKEMCELLITKICFLKVRDGDNELFQIVDDDKII